MTPPKSLRRRPRRIVQAAAVAAAAALGLVGCADTDAGGDEDTHTFILATGAMGGTPHSAVEQRYLDTVEERSGGRIEFDRLPFEALCDMDEVVDCIRDGRADIGTTVTDYTPHMLPSLSVVSVPFLNTDIQATVGGLADVHSDYAPAAELLDRNNLEYISTWPVGAMFIGSKEPVENIEDMDGLRARAAGPVTQSTLETVGVNVNAITASETYESLQRGVIDSVAAALDFGVNYQVTEQLPYWAEPGLGQYTAYGMWWNQESYESLPEDLQSTVDEVTEEFNDGTTVETYNEAMREVCDGMLASDDVESFIRWDEDATQEWQGLVGDQGVEQWLDIVDGYGFDEAEEYLDEYMAAYEANESPDNPLDAGLSCVDEWQEQNS